MLLIAFRCDAQTFDWGIVSDQGGKQSGNALAVDSTRQCIYVVGHHDQDFDLVFESEGTPPVYSGNLIIPHNGGQDGFLMKYSFEGELLWYNYFTGGGEQVPTGVDVDHDGNVYVTGYFKDNLICKAEDDSELFSYLNVDAGNSNLFVTSFDESGNLLWSDQQGGQDDDFAMDIAVDGNGVYVVGVFKNQNTVFHGYDIPDGLSSRDVFVLKYNLEGGYEWFTIAGGANDDYENSLDVRSSSLSIAAYNDRVYFIGAWSGSQVFFFENEVQLRSDMTLNSSDNSQDYYIAALSSEGSYLWTRSVLQEGNGGFGYGLAADCNGVYVGLTVAFNGSIVIYPDNSTDFAFNDQIIVMKLDPSNGLNLWENVYSTSGDNDDDVLRSMDVDGHGGLYVTGWFKTPFSAGLFGLGSYSPVDKEDVFVAKLNTSDGDEEWIRRLGDDENDYGYDIAVAGEDNIFVTGMNSGDMGSSPFAESSFAGSHNENFLLFRMTDNQVDPRVCCNLSLNPSSTDLSCFESNDGEISITPSGALGSVSFNWPTGTDYEGGNASNLSAGTYTVSAVDGAGCEASVDVVVSQPDQIMIDNLSYTDASCPDATDGEAEFRTYDFSGGGSLQVFDSPIVSAPAVSNNTVADSIFSSLSNLMVGDYEVYFEDDNGCRSDSLTVTIAGVDTIAPTLDCTTDTLTYYVDSSCDFTPTPANWFADLNPADNCSSTFSYNSTILNPGGVWTENVRDVLLEVEDEYGNVATCEIHFEVLDTIAPTISCISDQSLSLDSSCDVSLPDYTGMVSFADGCPNVTIDQSPASGTMLSGHGTVQEITMTATDESGNATSCTFDVVLEDHIDPVISCLGDLSESTDSNCDFSIPDYTGFATTSDNCDTSVDLTQSPAVGTIISGEGTTQIITLTAEDDAGNTSDCTFTVTLIDDIAPAITCPSDFTEATDAACNFVIPDYTGLATTSDNCDSSVEVTQSPAVNDVINGEGTTQLITLTAEDDAGNSTSCSFEITLVDNIDPVISENPSDRNVSLDGDCDFVIPDYTAEISPTDNCDSSVEVTQTPAVGDVFSGHGTTQTITLTAEDNAGNTASVDFEITLVDDTDPVISSVPDINEFLDGDCNFSIPDYTGLLTPTDNCDGDVEVTQTPAVGVVYSGHLTTQTITLTATDDAGNSAQTSFEITLIDNIAPTITTPADQNESTDGGCTFEIPDYTTLVTTSDNCDTDVEVTQNPVQGDIVSGENSTHTITLTAEDDAGNTISTSFEITLIDDIDPVISENPLDRNESLDTNCDFVIPDYTSEISPTDNCDSSVEVTQTPAVGDVFSGHGTTQTITLTAEDNAGNTASVDFEITLVDETDPVISSLSDINEYLDGGCNFSIPDYTGLLTPTDNCDGDVEVTQTPAVGVVYSGHLTTQTITLTATDDAGNSAQTSFEITLIDDIAPTITTPADQNESTDAGCTFEIPDYTTLVTTSDNCDTDVEVTQDPVQGDIVSGENSTHTITLTAEDDAGNTTSTSFEITLIDDIDPVISENPLDRNESLDGDCDFVIPDYTAEISPTDNCDPAVDVTQTPAIGAVFSGHGTTQTITLTAEDNAGNTASVDFEITLVDEIDPTITCPATQTYSLDSNCVFTVPDFISLATFSDNCDADLDVVQSPALGEIITDGDGTYTVTLTATDDALNSATCTFDLVLEDNTAPSFTCPGDDVLNLTDSCSTSLPDYITEMEEAGSFEDNCDIQTVTQTPLAGTEISSATTVIIEAIDINGNSTSCTFEVTLEDVESPQFETCPADTILIDLADQCDYVLEDFTTLVGATDNCTVVDLLQSPAPGAVTLQGNSSQSVTITATDDAGNSTICSFMVATVDDTAPVINDCPSDQTFNKDENCGFALPDFTGDVTYNEPCTATVNQSPSANTFITSDSTEVTLTVTDPYGNFSECIFYVYLEDNEAPTLTCNDLTIEVESCPIALPNFADSMLIEDNCEIASITQSPEVGDFVMPGEHEITLTAYDNSGNSTSCTFIVTYEDLTAPEIICPDDIVESAAPGECGKVITFDDPMGSDNCDVDNVEQIQGPSSGSFFEVGETLIEYEVTDFSGNTNTCSFTITVTDDEAPELTCPDDIVQCEQTVTFDAPMAVDNCEINTFDQTSSTIFQSGDTFPIGITTLEYTAEDIHGNLSTCSFTVEVEEPIDTELPDFPEGFCPEDSPADITTYVDSELNWNWIDGTDVDGIFNETEPGVYNLNFTAEIGTCFEEFNRELEVYPAAVADAGPDLETCGDMKEVNATTFGSQINWTASSPMVDANPSNLVEDPILVANEFGSYDLTLDVTTENGCTAQDQMSVAFYEMPGEPDAGEDYEFSFKYEVELQGNYAGAGDITWRTVAGQGTVVNESSPTTMITNLGEGTNIFEIEISNGVCPTTRDSAIVIVNGLNIPSGFSPNGDNKNDRYVIRGIENAITSEFRVFNRWGSLVYEVENYGNDWEGLSKGGNPLPEDTYFYVLEINESLSFRGYIVIRR